MLNVKSEKFNPFKPPPPQKKRKKRQEFWPRLQKKIELCSFFLQPSVAFWLDFNKNFVLYRMKVILGR